MVRVGGGAGRPADMAKSCKVAIRRGFKELAERLRQEAVKHRMLREVVEELALASRCPF